ncbi:Cysteine dioxygenase [Fusarium oxysporum f. sp. cubense race 1]|uniref:Cysteine dioxygenase n=1 Tax=Fusarium oxysporum f. sp. cubense (strain race 1) TaxID=1229664 RepID=N4UDI9_FUSC1|nr:Cysteine dioxygenase [Fusarium oxysporum f. sp. cubense race 1]
MADPSHFTDPFWEPQDQIPAESNAQPQVSPFKTANLLYSISSSWETTPVRINFAVGGLGTIAAKATSPKKGVTFTIRPKKGDEQPTLKLEITKDNCVLSKKEKDADEFVAYKEKLKFEPGEERNKFNDFVMFPKGKASALLELPEAIDESCRDPKKVCGEILEGKNTFGDKLETYLRITIGDNLADSPGIPYVMEIWPPGHKSPIHQHGDASAVIRVLYGKIQVSWFDKVEEGSPSQLIGNPVILEEGKVTWLGKDQYQVHQLENTSDTVCITLQCYQFDDDDRIHDEAFYWKDEEGHRRKFIPNSDKAYGQFVREVKAEWKKSH